MISELIFGSGKHFLTKIQYNKKYREGFCEQNDICFIFLYSKSKECVLFFQTVNENGCSVCIYKENQLSEEFHELDPNSIWEKIGLLKEWSGVTLFGLDNSNVKEKLEQTKKLLCFYDEWHNYLKMEQIFRYHLQKRTYSQVNWYSLFQE